MRTFDTPHTDPQKPSRNRGMANSSSAGFKAKSNEAVSSHSGNELVYDLRLNQASSQRFYHDIAAFSSRTVEEIGRRASRALDGYSRYVTENLLESPRTRGEYGLELLTVGMALQLYGVLAAKTPGWVVAACRELFWLRRRSTRIKPVIDWVRAGIFQRFLRRQPRLSDLSGSAVLEHFDVGNATSFDALPGVIKWMHATGEFEQESRRLDNWMSYLHQLPRIEAESWIGIALSLFDWFEREADAVLGIYTPGVPPFLKGTYPTRFRREDQIFCGREPVEYHLGMVAAEVMNDGLREDFLGKPRKVLLVPTCMRGEQKDQCRAVAHGLDLKCAGCDPACAINRITLRMRSEGVQVYMVPHATGFSRWLERWQHEPDVGVAAVACMLNILPGGYEMRARRIASQCVPLDYPGCQKHWTSGGVPTGVNEEQLVHILTGSRP
jgi:hypothetical protein